MQGKCFTVHCYIVGELSQFCFDKNKNNFCINIGTQNTISRENFTVSEKSAKTTNVFSYIAFII